MISRPTVLMIVACTGTCHICYDMSMGVILTQIYYIAMAAKFNISTFYLYCVQAKCQQYWPDKGSKVCGNIKVTLHKEEQLANYCIHQFFVEQVLCCCKISVVSHLCCCYHRFLVLKMKYD